MPDSKNKTSSGFSGTAARPLPPMRPLYVRDLGLRDYEPIWHAMQQFTAERDADTPDELWVLEHPPIFTLGQAADDSHVLAAGDIPVLKVDRGGQVTYHGPGQLVAYPLIDLKRLGIGIKRLVHIIEETVIEALATHDIIAVRKDGAPGVYVDDQKVASLGLRVKRGCSFHGLAFNVNMDLEPFQRINPCGYAGLQVTQTSELGAFTKVPAAAKAVVSAFASALGYKTIEKPADIAIESAIQVVTDE